MKKRRPDPQPLPPGGERTLGLQVLLARVELLARAAARRAVDRAARQGQAAADGPVH